MAAAHSPRQARINSEAPGSVKRWRWSTSPFRPWPPGSWPPGAPCATKRRSRSGSPRRPRPCVTAS